ncbi:uncharacterized protein [Hoplias malabaricus]|uniref:uncharacterized protein n=1 Tax=Hoplias malabaricus TaxID=27720 RepID=UPI003462D748
MPVLIEDIKAIILKTLPNVSEENCGQLISILQNCGVENKDDLRYVQQEDICEFLPVIQLRKLLEAFKLETETLTLNMEVISSHSPPSSPTACPPSNPSLHSDYFLSHGYEQSSSPSTSLSSETDSSGPNTGPLHISKTWPERFQVPWEKMPPEIQTAISSGKRPKPPECRQMVRILVSEMRKFELCPTRAQCLTVCRNIIRQYPNSFADMFPDGSVMAGGYTSLLIQVKTRIENLNRESNYTRHRASASNTGRKMGPSDTYGCVRFQPQLPPEETEETVEAKRQRLQEIYSQEGMGGVERSEVKNLMETTFCLLRQHLNTAPPPSVQDLRSQWPYLFNQKSLFCHFQLLTDINVLRALEISMAECGGPITEYFKSKSKDANVKAVISKTEDVEEPFRVVQLIMAHFQENTNGLIFHADTSATAADVERTLTLPASPRLILLGTELVIQGWMISLEGHVICEGVLPAFLTGLATMFAIYYVFNLQYQEEASCTLEFIQRRFIGINPERGTKTSRGKVVSKKTGRIVNKKSFTVNPRVSTLLKYLMDFQWDFI